MSTPVLDQDDLAALPIFPLPDAALFPGAMLPLHVFEPRYRDLTRDALAGRKLLAVARLKPGYEREYAARPPVFDVCGVGEIVEHGRYADGRYDIILRGLSRVRIVDELPPLRSYRQVNAEIVPDVAPDHALGAALETQISALWHSLAPHLPEAVRDLRALTEGATDLGAFADRIAATMADPDLTLLVLTQADPCDRLQALVSHLHQLCDAVRPRKRRPSSELN